MSRFQSDPRSANKGLASRVFFSQINIWGVPHKYGNFCFPSGQSVLAKCQWHPRFTGGPSWSSPTRFVHLIFWANFCFVAYYFRGKMQQCNYIQSHTHICWLASKEKDNYWFHTNLHPSISDTCGKDTDQQVMTKRLHFRADLNFTISANRLQFANRSLEHFW